MSDFVLGVDLGQTQDFTALAAVELVKSEIHLRYLQRVPLGTPYPEVSARIVALVQALSAPTDLVVDATGVGRPVLDLLRDAGLDPVAVSITGGRAITFDGDIWKVPKRNLVRALVTAFEAGRLKVARGLQGAGALKRELRAFKRCISPRGHDTYEGRAGAHDDLVIATALACWWVDAGDRFRSGAPDTVRPLARAPCGAAPRTR